MEGCVDLGYGNGVRSRTRDLSITSPTPYHYTTEATRVTSSLTVCMQCRIKVGAIDAAALGPFVK